MKMSQELKRLQAQNDLLSKLLLQQAHFRVQSKPQREEVLFLDFYRKWLQHKQAEIQPSTYFEYTRIFENYIVPHFSPKQKMLSEITPEDITAYYRWLKNVKGMTNNSVIRHHANLYTCFKYAYLRDMLPAMVMDKVPRPKAEKQKTFNYYTMDELLELFSIARGSNIYTPILLSSILGLRRSELLALKWDAVDFHAGTVTIKRKMTRDKSMGGDTVSRNLKSEASLRTLVIPDFLISHLELLKKDTAKLPTREYANFIYVDRDGKLPTLNMITNRFRDFIQKSGLKKIRFHDLRHSCATLLLGLGYPMKDIQAWLGHSSYQTTANIYTHIDLNDKKMVACGLQQAIGRNMAGQKYIEKEGLL